MPSVTNLTVNDGASTPVEVTFRPESISGGNATFRDNRNEQSVLMPRIIVQFSAASANRPSNRVAFRVNYPVKKTVDGVDVLDKILRSETNFVLPDGATTQQRKDLLAFHVNALNEALIRGVIEDVEPIWGA